MQNGVMLSVIMVSVMAPFQQPQSQSGLRSTEKNKKKKILKFFILAILSGTNTPAYYEHQ